MGIFIACLAALNSMQVPVHGEQRPPPPLQALSLWEGSLSTPPSRLSQGCSFLPPLPSGLSHEHHPAAELSAACLGLLSSLQGCNHH